MNAHSVLWHGVDTAKVGYLVRWPAAMIDTYEHYARLKEQARAAEKAEGLVTVKLGHPDVTFQVLPQGARMLAYGFEGYGMKVFVGDTQAPWTHGGHATPNVRFEFQPYSVAQHGLPKVHRFALDILQGMGGQVDGHLLSEIHLTCDVETDRPHRPSDYHATLDRLWSRVRTRLRSNGQEHEVQPCDMGMETAGQKLKLVHIGKDKKMLRIYDKLLELQTHPDKIFEAVLWSKLDFARYLGDYRYPEPPQTSAMRVEFQLRRERLVELGISTVEDFLAQQAGLWSHLTREFVTLINDDDTNRSRCPTQAWWKVVQEAWTDGDACTVAKRRKGLPPFQKYVDQGLGILLAAGARLGSPEELTLPGILEKVLTAWEAKHPECWQERLERKRQKLQILWASLPESERLDLQRTDPTTRFLPLSE